MCRVRIDRNTDIYYTDFYLQYYIDYTNMVFKTCLDSHVASSVV